MVKKTKFGPKVGSKSKVVIEWKDKPENYSQEAKKHIIAIASERYGVTKDMVKVNFIPTKYNEKGEVIDVSTDVINNIQDPKFQLKLFSDYINENNITDVDMEFIKKIDSEINSKIDYEIYDKYKKYRILWLEWDYFQSYGPGNRFDLCTLDGLTLINGVPGNMSGKTTLSQDLISFLLYGKSQKPYTLSQCFNKYSDSKFFSVKGCVEIDNTQYIIERLVTRSKKRNGEWGDASQEVKYYEVINNEKIGLEEYGKNVQEEHSIKTNKVIKEAIGSEKDFNMIVSATADDLDALINLGNAEKGRLLSKWIGLFPLEEKDKIGKDKYKEFEKNLKSRIYDIPTLESEIKTLDESIIDNNNGINELNERLTEIETNIKETNIEKETLLSSKKVIDESVLKIDLTTVNRKMETLERDANTKKQELKLYEEEYDKVKDSNFSDEDYRQLNKLDKDYSIEINNIRNEINNLKETNKQLTESEYCPTCKRKYEGLDNSKAISDNTEKINGLIKKGVALKEKSEKNKDDITKMESEKIKYDKKLKLESHIAIIPVQLENLRTSYREQTQLIKDYNSNKSAIELNNQIDISLTNINAKLKAYDIEQKDKIQKAENLKRNIIDNKKKIDINNILIDEIKTELVKIRNWKVYLEMVGKNGVSKMVLRKTLPIINSELSRILDDVCDFDVEVYLNDKNEVMFNIIRDDVASDLAGASGFEKTASALALRHVLGNISTMPRPNFITLDEILGKVSKEFYDNIHNLYSKIVDSYQFVLHITHIEDIKDWHKNVITINKGNDNMSTIKVSKISDLNN